MISLDYSKIIVKLTEIMHAEIYFSHLKISRGMSSDIITALFYDSWCVTPILIVQKGSPHIL